MLSPALTLSPEKPSLADSALLSLRANAGNVNFPDAGNNRFQENLDRQISDQQNIYRQRSDQQNSDRLARQQADRQAAADRANDQASAAASARDDAHSTNDYDNTGRSTNGYDNASVNAGDTAGADTHDDARSVDLHDAAPQDSTVGDNTHASRDAASVDAAHGSKTGVHATRADKKVAKADAKEAEAENAAEGITKPAAVQGDATLLSASSPETSKAGHLKAADDPDASLPSAALAITALIDSREAGEKLTVAWKKRESRAVGNGLVNAVNHGAVSAKHATDTTQTAVESIGASPDSPLSGDKKSASSPSIAITGNETLNPATLVANESGKDASAHGEKTPGNNTANDVSTLVNQLNLAMGMIGASAKTPHSVRLSPALFARDSGVASMQAVAVSAADANGKTPTPATAITTATHTSVVSPDFINRLSEQVLWLRHQQIQVAELRLHPRDLGSLRVRIDSSGDHTTVNFVAAHDSVRDVLDQNLVKLHQLFSDAGLNLTQVHVSSDAPSLASQGGMSGSGHSADYQSTSLSQQGLNQDAVDAEAVPVTDASAAQSIHLVDFFA